MKNKLYHARIHNYDGEREYSDDTLIIAPSLEKAEKQAHDYLSTYWGDDTEKVIVNDEPHYEGDGGEVISELDYIAEIVSLEALIGVTGVLNASDKDAAAILRESERSAP